jgi:hypothetical protein
MSDSLASLARANLQIDIQTLPWPTIVHLISQIRKHNPITSLSNDPQLANMAGGEDELGDVKKLDAHDVAKYVTFAHPLTLPFLPNPFLSHSETSLSLPCVCSANR